MNNLIKNYSLSNMCFHINGTSFICNTYLFILILD